MFSATAGFKLISNFELYVTPTTDRPNLNPVAKTKAKQPWSAGLLVHDGGTDATRIYACTIAGNDHLGWVKKSEGICRVNGSQTSARFKLLMK